jgi:O-antigen/teichoic acid export membrane protein
VIFGARWGASVPVIQLLAAAGVAHSLTTLNWTVLQATGRVGLALRLNVFLSAVTVAGFAIGVHWGAAGVATSYAIVKWLLVPIDTWVTTRALSYNFWEALLAGGLAVPPSVLSTAGAFGARALLVHEGVPPPIRLFVVGAIGAGLYLALLVITAPSVVREARNLLRRNRNGAPRDPIPVPTVES